MENFELHIHTDRIKSPHLVMQADELEGLHAELELFVVGGRVDLNSRVHGAAVREKQKVHS